MSLETTSIPGCYTFRSAPAFDLRGSFQKVYSEIQTQIVDGWQLPTPAEIFWSKSHRGVARGLHFQNPPYAVSKFVVCISGSITDVIVDLRSDSPTYKRSIAIELSADQDRPTAVFAPIGCAHGFITDSEESTVMYLQSGTFHEQSDTGIDFVDVVENFTSLNTQILIQSDRDKSFPRLIKSDYWDTQTWNSKDV